MSALLARVKVIASSIVSFLTGLAVLWTALVTQVTPNLPNGWQDNAAQIGAVVAAWLAAVIVVIRNVTPIEDASQRGLLGDD